MTLSASKVSENSAGAVIGTLSVTDPDAGDKQSFSVSDGRFEVVNNQLKLKSGVSLDYEQGSSVSVTVTATDGGNNQISKAFTVNVGDVNEAQTGMSLGTSSVAENAKGAVIGTVSVIDPDAGDSQSYQVSDSRFEVVNNQLKLKSGVSLDFETEPSVTVKVTATDQGGHAIAKDFTVNVTNVNEAPTVTSKDGSGREPHRQHQHGLQSGRERHGRRLSLQQRQRRRRKAGFEPAERRRCVEHDPVGGDAGVGDLPEGSGRQPQHGRHLPVRQ